MDICIHKYINIHIYLWHPHFVITCNYIMYVVYIYMYIYIYIYLYIFKFICIYIFTYIYTYTSTHISVYIYIYIYTLNPYTRMSVFVTPCYKIARTINIRICIDYLYHCSVAQIIVLLHKCLANFPHNYTRNVYIYDNIYIYRCDTHI